MAIFILSPAAIASKSHDSTTVFVSVIVINEPSFEEMMRTPNLQDVTMPPKTQTSFKTGILHSEWIDGQVLKTEL